MTAGLRAVTVPLEDPPDPLSLLAPEGGPAWITDNTSLVARGPYLRVDPGTGPGRFARAVQAIDALFGSADVTDRVDAPGTGPVVFGSWTFDEEAPDSRLLVPSVVYGFGEDAAWKTTVEFPAGSAQAGSIPHRWLGRSLPEADWIEAVARAVAEIDSGRIEKVVLARKVELSTGPEAEQQALAGALHRAYPGCFTFCFDDLIGASPELLIRRLGDVVDSGPLAGSAPRGSTPDEDAELGRRLRESEKDLQEHALAVATVMDKLTPWCRELIKEPEPSVLLLANVQHLSTKVQGRLAGSANALELAGALHPTAAVCGVPQDEAVQVIRELEGFDRGRYSGPIGWMDRHGDGEWALALRCARITPGRAEVFAGAGIVAQSDPQRELEETRLKLEAVLTALREVAPV